MDNLQAIERFTRLEASITLAAQAFHRAGGTPRLLDDVLNELERDAHAARQQLQKHAGQEATDPARLFESADALKVVGDRAAQLCEGEGDRLDPELRRCVQDMQNEIAHFRRQLHGSENRRVSRPAVVRKG